MSYVGIGGMLIIILKIVICWGNFFRDAIPDVIKKMKAKLCKKKKKKTKKIGWN